MDCGNISLVIKRSQTPSHTAGACLYGVSATVSVSVCVSDVTGVFKAETVRMSFKIDNDKKIDKYPVMLHNAVPRHSWLFSKPALHSCPLHSFNQLLLFVNLSYFFVNYI